MWIWISKASGYHIFLGEIYIFSSYIVSLTSRLSNKLAEIRFRVRNIAKHRNLFSNSCKMLHSHWERETIVHLITVHYTIFSRFFFFIIIFIFFYCEFIISCGGGGGSAKWRSIDSEATVMNSWLDVRK